MTWFFEKILIRILGTVRINVSANLLDQILSTLWTVARHISLLLVILLLYFFILFNNPQGIDIVEEVLINKKYWAWTIFALISFGVSLWFCSFFVLQLKEISSDQRFLKHYREGVKFWIVAIPRILGIVPFVSLLFKTSLYSGSSIWFLLILFVTVFILSIIQEELVVVLEKQVINVRWFDEISPEKKTLSSLLYFRGFRAMFYGFLGYIFLLFILSVTSVETGFATTVGPFAVMIFGLSFLSLIFSLVMYFNLPGRRPFILYFAALIVVCGIVNDNTQIRTLPMKSTRITLESDFRRWAEQLIALQGADSAIVQEIPVIFVAAEGGGIRALTWTALILENLEKRFPGMYQSIYGISGVSGGGVGASFYISYLYDQLKRDRKIDANEAAFHKAVKADFLSDLLAGFLFQDNLQNILPVGIEGFNRTRQLEDAWSKSFSANTNSFTMDRGFLRLYADAKMRIPRLFINGVLAESGQKTIVSFPMLRNDSLKAISKPDVFADELDVIEAINKDIPVKTVASLCSRFPYITSGGLICGEGGGRIGKIVDGGYKENTGLETVWQLILRLRPVFKDLHKIYQKKNIRFKPIVIFIKNSLETKTMDMRNTHSIVLSEALLPLGAASKASDRKTPTLSALTENVFKYYDEKGSDSLSCEFIQVELDRSTEQGYRLPLGWYFSEASFNYIDTLVANRFKTSDHTFDRLRTYFLKE